MVVLQFAGNGALGFVPQGVQVQIRVAPRQGLFTVGQYSHQRPVVHDSLNACDLKGEMFKLLQALSQELAPQGSRV